MYVKDDITLITRPRRFGKTLNINMVDRFFSNLYDDQEKLFSHLKIWQDEDMRALAGQFPVIFLSFADIKEETFEAARDHVISLSSAAGSYCSLFKVPQIETLFLRNSNH